MTELKHIASPARSGARRAARACHGFQIHRAVICLLAMLVLAMAVRSEAAVLKDLFAERQLLTDSSGRLDGNNANAALEPGEPRHGGKTGGHSLWISWLAPTNGVVKFQTEASSFDTLLSAYYFPSTNDTALSQLVEMARADDSEGLDHESKVEFGVLAGRRYEIAVDGYFGASGELNLRWAFDPTTLPPPIILSSPADRAVNLGDVVVLTVVLTNAANGDYRWYHNTNALDATGTTLVIPNVQATNVGRYKLRVRINGPNYFSVPAEIQINSDGVANSSSVSKYHLDRTGNSCAR